MPYFRFLQKDPKTLPEWIISKTDWFSFVEINGDSWVYFPLQSDEDAEQIIFSNPSFLKFERADIKDTVDWEQQWAAHCPEIQNCSIRIDLSKYTNQNQNTRLLYLKAGPGFGDLSHPTTRLTLSLMSDHVRQRDVLDIGCGSGILSLAAILLGAKSATGIDIDLEALKHARENAVLNQFEDRAIFACPTNWTRKYSDNTVIVMNMIRTQQQEAWLSMSQSVDLKGECFTSGILSFEKDLYVHECNQRGWSLITLVQEGDWLGFHWKI